MRKPEEILNDMQELARDIQDPGVIWPYEWSHYAATLASLELELNAFVKTIVDNSDDKA